MAPPVTEVLGVIVQNVRIPKHTNTIDVVKQKIRNQISRMTLRGDICSNDLGFEQWRMHRFTEESLHTAMAKIRDLDKKVADHDKKFADQDEVIADHQRENTHLYETISAHQVEVIELREQVTDLHREYWESKADHQKEIMDHNKKIADHQREIIYLRKSISAHDKEISELQKKNRESKADHRKETADLHKEIMDHKKEISDLHRKTAPIDNYEILRLCELRRAFGGRREFDRLSRNEIAHGGSIIFDVRLIDRYQATLSYKDFVILSTGFSRIYGIIYREFKMHYEDKLAPYEIIDTLDKRANLKYVNHRDNIPVMKSELQTLCNKIITTWTQTFDYDENLATLCHDLKVKYDRAFIELVELA